MKLKTLTDVVIRSWQSNEKLDLHKLEHIMPFKPSTDDKQLRYIRGFIWRKYGIRIKFPIDVIVLFMIDDAVINYDRYIRECYKMEQK